MFFDYYDPRSSADIWIGITPKVLARKWATDYTETRRSWIGRMIYDDDFYMTYTSWINLDDLPSFQNFSNIRGPNEYDDVFKNHRDEINDKIIDLKLPQLLAEFEDSSDLSEKAKNELKRRIKEADTELFLSVMTLDKPYQDLKKAAIKRAEQEELRRQEARDAEAGARIGDEHWLDWDSLENPN